MRRNTNCIWGWICQFSALLLICLFFLGCSKEYSYERTDPVQGPPPIPVDTTGQGDSLNNQPVMIPGCFSCNTQIEAADSSWQFSVGNASLCGSVTGAVISRERNALTFFGPSKCSLDSGLIITAYFSTEPLTSDKNYLQADRASMAYYDNTTLVNVIESYEKNQFKLVVDSYVHQTGILKGRFTGLAIFKNGDTSLLKSSSFQVRLK
jgi:hypothetical protein